MRYSESTYTTSASQFTCLPSLKVDLFMSWTTSSQTRPKVLLYTNDILAHYTFFTTCTANYNSLYMFTKQWPTCTFSLYMYTTQLLAAKVAICNHHILFVPIIMTEFTDKIKFAYAVSVNLASELTMWAVWWTYSGRRPCLFPSRGE